MCPFSTLPRPAQAPFQAILLCGGGTWPKAGRKGGLPHPCPTLAPQALRMTQTLSRESFVPTAGRTTTNEELEDMLESGKLAIFTDDVSLGWGGICVWKLFASPPFPN